MTRSRAEALIIINAGPVLNRAVVTRLAVPWILPDSTPLSPGILDNTFVLARAINTNFFSNVTEAVTGAMAGRRRTSRRGCREISL